MVRISQLDVLRDAARRGVPQRYQGENMVFVVGCSRSGTTWLQRLLASHPRVRTGQESHLFNHYLAPLLRSWHFEVEKATASDQLVGRGGLGLPCYFTEEEFLDVLHQFMERLLEPMVGRLEAGQIYVEKTPPHALFLREIKELLPASRVIHVLRDGRDVVASMLAASRSWGARWAPRWPHTAARAWVTNIEAVRRARTLFGEDQFVEVRYEALQNRPESVLRQLASFLDLHWTDAAIVSAIRANRADPASRESGTPIPLGGMAARHRQSAVVTEPPGFVRRGKAGSWKSDLSPTEKLLTWAQAGRTLRQTGYVRSWRDWL